MLYQQSQERARNLFDQRLQCHRLEPLSARTVSTLQVNLGRLCNQACRHCHVDAGPQHSGPELNMDEDTADAVIAVLEEAGSTIGALDLTGGAPELNPHFRRIVEAARAQGIRVMDRCNLTVLFEKGQEDLADFLAAAGVDVVASLPYYRRERTDRQRGAGVFERSISGLQLLNERGHGVNGRLQLSLVFNPVGAYLPGNQAQLETLYKRELFNDHGIRFNHLYCITNMPIARFLEWLVKSENLEPYMQTLLDAFNPKATEVVMCRDMISVGPDGSIYDCDFNQMLSMPVGPDAPRNIRDFDITALSRRQIATGPHCLGCTAGAGSSCGGTVT